MSRTFESPGVATTDGSPDAGGRHSGPGFERQLSGIPLQVVRSSRTCSSSPSHEPSVVEHWSSSTLQLASPPPASAVATVATLASISARISAAVRPSMHAAGVDCDSAFDQRSSKRAAQRATATPNVDRGPVSFAHVAGAAHSTSP